jgi:hypothetical protein
MIKLAVVHHQLPSRQHDPKLLDRAKVHWPNNENYQQQWIRMVNLLRAGRGWVLEGGKVNWHSTQK